MKLPTLFAFAISSILVFSCVTRGPQVLSKGSNSEIDAEALRIARADIAAGQPRICHAGTRGVSAVGVPAESIDLVSNLPRLPLPSGCTDSLALPAVRFAKVYNTEILRHLQQTR